jgi:signal peptidase I
MHMRSQQEEDEVMSPKWKVRLRKIWREWVKPIGVVIIVLSTFRSAVADWNDVPTGSMKPTIIEGDRVFVNKLAYGLRVPFTDYWAMQWSGPQRGDVVICFAPDSGDRLVKRVVGIPGDRLELRNNHLLVNEEPVKYDKLDQETIEQIDPEGRESFVFASEDLTGHVHPVMITPRVRALRDYGPITVPANHYFIMGDNRDGSRDSRVFGFVPRNDIVGEAGPVVISLDRDRFYVPRWDRFFRGLP